MPEPTSAEDASSQALFRLGAAEGGRARARSLTKEQRSEIARRAAEARWDSDAVRATQKANHVGSLDFGAQRIECAVLADGTRVLSQGTVMEALGRAKSMGRRGDEESKRPPFLSAANLDPFISPKLLSELTPIKYRVPHSRFPSLGYLAQTLPEVCEVYLDARKAGALLPSQEAAADAAELLIRSFAKVGIIALVDEATGYQEVRDREELRQLLEQYVEESFRPWVKVFPDVFFAEIYRLHAWTANPKAGRHPGYVGTFINTYVYDLLPEGVADELRRVNPVTEKGRRARKHHQHLTIDTGNKHLDRQITTVTTLMQVSDDVEDFKRLFDRRFAEQRPVRSKVLHVTVQPNDEVQRTFVFDDLDET